MAHHQLCFNLLDSFKRNTNNDDDRCAANSDILQAVRECADDQRQQCDNAKEQRADKHNLSKRLGDKVCGRLARAEAWDKAAVLLQIIGNFDRIKLD